MIGKMGLPLNSVLGASKIAGFVSSLLFYVSTNSGVEVGSILAVYSGVATGWVVYTVVAAESGFVLWCCFQLVVPGSLLFLVADDSSVEVGSIFVADSGITAGSIAVAEFGVAVGVAKYFTISSKDIPEFDAW
ncbi:hypothetical protein POTOM_048817 [Populus tomentosa]|uniref:Uncharacterized protein n=1 Tax=Populus tomentosa TaxID=118781 RepID=A0A8X8CC26_POPTO|nr:hypothetical protein POTOM_048817 [Populus tomentosa]